MNDILVLTIGDEEHSAARLGFLTKTYIDYTDEWKENIIVRWGNSCLFRKNEDSLKPKEFDKVINPSKAIKQNCEKNLALQKLAEVVDTPKIYSKKIPLNQRAVYRPVFHTGGYGFTVVTGPREIECDYYATQFIKTDLEYRVWFAGSGTLCAIRVSVSKENDSQYPCRSHFGYDFCDKVPANLHKQTLLAAKKIGLEMGAADVLCKNGKYYFLELNSAPTLDTKKIVNFYTKNIYLLLKKKFNYTKSN